MLFSFVCLIVLRIGSNTPKQVCCPHPIRAGCMILGKLFKPDCEKYGEIISKSQHYCEDEII